MELTRPDHRPSEGPLREGPEQRFATVRVFHSLGFSLLMIRVTRYLPLLHCAELGA